ncbi:MAG: hypothetical protein R3E01_22975 [Pirellulaceae bacterium]
MAKPKSKSSEPNSTPSPVGEANTLGLHHLVLGWTALIVFLALGLTLELLHAFKSEFYLDDRVGMRRMMWTLAHSHGTLFALIHIAFGVTLRVLPTFPLGMARIASGGLWAGLLTMPTGFFLGGIWLHDGDPGLGVIAVPVGALAMVIGCIFAAAGLSRAQKQN